MIVFKKKQIIMLALVVMVGIAGFLNWRYEGNMASTDSQTTKTNGESDGNIGKAKMVDGNDDSTEVSKTDGDFFASCRLNRESVRSKSLEILNSTINNSGSTAETKEEASQQVIKISKNVEVEGNIENLIKAKGFSDAVVFINDDSVSVTVKTDGLTAPETAQIKDIIMEQTNNDNINIVEIK